MTNEQPPADDPWGEVGRQFKTLGESLATAFRSSANDPQTRQHLRNMQGGLEAMVQEVSQVIKEAGAAPPVQEVKARAKRAAESTRVASEQALQDARPQLVSALQQVNSELQKLIDRLAKPPAGGGPSEPGSGVPAGPLGGQGGDAGMEPK